MVDWTMTRRKTGRAQETWANRVSAEVGVTVQSARATAKALGVGVELLVGLAQRGAVDAVPRTKHDGATEWFFTDKTIAYLKCAIGGVRDHE